MDLWATLYDKGLKLALAESCTGGLLSHTVTNIPGSSKFFMGSVVAYSNDLKTDILDVSASTIRRFGTVSEECALEMAQGARLKLDADIGLSTTGIAGPTGGSAEKPVGTVFIAISTAQGSEAKKLSLNGTREEIKASTVACALELLERSIK